MKNIVILALVFNAIISYAVEVPERLLEAISIVESNNNDRAIGDSGKAVGRFQIHKTYVDEVNRICKLKRIGKTFTYEDRTDGKKSREMVVIYLSFWGDQYQKNTGKTATMEVIAKIHNGHAFWKRNPSLDKNKKYFQNINRYWNKVNAKLR